MVEIGTELNSELAQGPIKTVGKLTVVGRYTQGRRPNVEDRFGYRQVTTKGGLQLTVAIVADGIGGSKSGEVAAQMTVDLVYKFILESEAAQVGHTPKLLRLALENANEQVYKTSKSDKDKAGMGTTAAIVAICGTQLYVANVGDSRIYLFREGQGLVQITIDHSWANEMIRNGSLDVESALKHPKADELVRSIGYEPKLKVDLGLYGTGQTEETAARENQGKQLEPGDRLVICSDGLIKERHDDKSLQYISDEELKNTLATWPAEKAADQLIQTVSNRQVDDNATVVIIENEGAKHASALEQLWLANQKLIIGGLAGLFGLAIVLGLILWNLIRPEAGPEIVEDQVAAETALESNSEEEPIEPRDEVEIVVDEDQAPETPAEYGEGVVTLGASTDKTFIDLETIRLNGGSLVIQTLDTPVTAVSKFGDKALIAPNSQAGISYLNDEFSLHCFVGTCTLTGSVGGDEVLEPSQKAFVGISGKVSDIQDAQNNLFAFAPKVATPTPLPTDTPTPLPTDTPIPTNTLPPPPPTIPSIATKPAPEQPPAVDPNAPTATPYGDTDGDGVADWEDNCPNKYGGADKQGCPSGGGPVEDSRDGTETHPP